MAALSAGVLGDLVGEAAADGDGFDRFAGVFTGDEGLASRLIVFLGLDASGLTAM